RYGRGEIATADSIFQRTLPLMPAAERCIWTDLGVLLDQAGRNAYADIPCEQRDAINTRIWWLATPMFTEAGNERRAEHFARLVDIRLRSSDDPAERWDWQPTHGGLAIRDMILRYGWPAYSYWAGHFEDVDHYTIYLGIRDTAIINAGIFATAEYPITRVHTIPWWYVIADPWHADDGDWTVSMPIRPDSTPDFGWWPREHAPHAGETLVQLGDKQSAVFRRESDVLLAVATDVRAADLHAAVGDQVQGTLILSPVPDSFVFIPHPSVVGTTVVMQDRMSPTPVVVGMEYRSTRTKAAARTRFAVSPPATLSSMLPGEIAVSEPALIRPTSLGTRAPSDPTIAIPLMLGSATFPHGARVGVYWETYGVHNGETLDVAVRVSQRPPNTPGTQRPTPTTVNSPPTGITVQWREPDPDRAVTAIPGAHPIQARNVSLDLSSLQPGDYEVEVSVARPGTPPVAARREIIILP
ncbi:MAG TPA: hypothetical protein VMH39_09025, partial [Gemmatimonadaceae bacterium]|nr:hypothetical protein [Gemmatimonadaceae bacterium]